jgi:hypothetical protein
VTVFATDHEEVVFCHDRASGLRAIIAIYSTALGPSLGGTRFYPYETEADALADVLNLSRGMAYKNALAGLDHGGGKAVIWGDPTTDKTEALLRAYGRFVESLGGRYVTACDVGTYVQDMDVVARESRFVTGRSPSEGGAGDSSVLTAWGVFQGMRACAERQWGTASLAGRRVGIAGVGKVGRHLVDHLVDDGAEVVVTDVSAAAVATVVASHPQVRTVADADALVRTPADVYAPCALGGALSDAGRRRAHRAGRLRRRQQPAGPPRGGEDPGRPRRALRAGLRGQLRRCDPGRRRVPGLRAGAGARPRRRRSSRPPGASSPRPRRRRPTCGCGRSAGRAADGRGRSAARDPGPRPGPLMPPRSLRRWRTCPKGAGDCGGRASVAPLSG